MTEEQSRIPVLVVAKMAIEQV
uniref:Uncharacterized protein n=1 Tax=Arundo donax TaxID=35708 RepID=A0A0A8Y3L4_ARUDO